LLGLLNPYTTAKYICQELKCNSKKPETFLVYNIADMSGHSKWATTHRQKEVKDAKRGAIFTKLGAQIAVAVREGGGVGDPDKNFRLRLVIDKAREFNMPKENIARAIEKGMGAGGGVALSEVIYEGFLPGGAAVMIEALTDNKARTVQLIRSAMETSGGTLGSSGSVSYMFIQTGELVVNLSGKNPEQAELDVIDLGATDFEPEGDKLIIYCEKENIFTMKEQAEKKGYKVESAELVMRPQNLTEVTDPETRLKVESLLERIEDLEDVSKVWTNYA
jgi:YebC/PmpR family DNA-binding regulatory protein